MNTWMYQYETHRSTQHRLFPTSVPSAGAICCPRWRSPDAVRILNRHSTPNTTRRKPRINRSKTCQTLIFWRFWAHKVLSMHSSCRRVATPKALWAANSVTTLIRYKCQLICDKGSKGRRTNQLPRFDWLPSQSATPMPPSASTKAWAVTSKAESQLSATPTSTCCKMVQTCSPRLTSAKAVEVDTLKSSQLRKQTRAPSKCSQYQKTSRQHWTTTPIFWTMTNTNHLSGSETATSERTWTKPR